MPSAVEVVKKAAVEAVEAAKPVQLLFGQVVSINPLKIAVDQKVVLTEKMLLLCQSVTDFTTDATLSGQTGETVGGTGESAFAAHSHPITGTKQARIHLALKAGEQVVLLRMQGGGRYLVLGRVGGL